jgi:hypothetical protein
MSGFTIAKRSSRIPATPALLAVEHGGIGNGILFHRLMVITRYHGDKSIIRNQETGAETKVKTNNKRRNAKFTSLGSVGFRISGRQR